MSFSRTFGRFCKGYRDLDLKTASAVCALLAMIRFNTIQTNRVSLDSFTADNLEKDKQCLEAAEKEDLYIRELYINVVSAIIDWKHENGDGNQKSLGDVIIKLLQ